MSDYNLYLQCYKDNATHVTYTDKVNNRANGLLAVQNNNITQANVPVTSDYFEINDDYNNSTTLLGCTNDNHMTKFILPNVSEIGQYFLESNGASYTWSKYHWSALTYTDTNFSMTSANDLNRVVCVNAAGSFGNISLPSEDYNYGYVLRKNSDGSFYFTQYSQQEITPQTTKFESNKVPAHFICIDTTQNNATYYTTYAFPTENGDYLLTRNDTGYTWNKYQWSALTFTGNNFRMDQTSKPKNIICEAEDTNKFTTIELPNLTENKTMYLLYGDRTASFYFLSDKLQVKDLFFDMLNSDANMSKFVCCNDAGSIQTVDLPSKDGIKYMIKRATTGEITYEQPYLTMTNTNFIIDNEYDANTAYFIGATNATNGNKFTKFPIPSSPGRYVLKFDNGTYNWLSHNTLRFIDEEFNMMDSSNAISTMICSNSDKRFSSLPLPTSVNTGNGYVLKKNTDYYYWDAYNQQDITPATTNIYTNTPSVTLIGLSNTNPDNANYTTFNLPTTAGKYVLQKSTSGCSWDQQQPQTMINTNFSIDNAYNAKTAYFIGATNDTNGNKFTKFEMPAAVDGYNYSLKYTTANGYFWDTINKTHLTDVYCAINNYQNTTTYLVGCTNGGEFTKISLDSLAQDGASTYMLQRATNGTYSWQKYELSKMSINTNNFNYAASSKPTSIVACDDNDGGALANIVLPTTSGTTKQQQYLLQFNSDGYTTGAYYSWVEQIDTRNLSVDTNTNTTSYLIGWSSNDNKFTKLSVPTNQSSANVGYLLKRYNNQYTWLSYDTSLIDYSRFDTDNTAANTAYLLGCTTANKITKVNVPANNNKSYMIKHTSSGIEYEEYQGIKDVKYEHLAAGEIAASYIVGCDTDGTFSQIGLPTTASGTQGYIMNRDYNGNISWTPYTATTGDNISNITPSSLNFDNGKNITNLFGYNANEQIFVNLGTAGKSEITADNYLINYSAEQGYTLATVSPLTTISSPEETGSYILDYYSDSNTYQWNNASPLATITAPSAAGSYMLRYNNGQYNWIAYTAPTVTNLTTGNLSFNNANTTTGIIGYNKNDNKFTKLNTDGNGNYLINVNNGAYTLTAYTGTGTTTTSALVDKQTLTISNSNYITIVGTAPASANSNRYQITYETGYTYILSLNLTLSLYCPGSTRIEGYKGCIVIYQDNNGSDDFSLTYGDSNSLKYITSFPEMSLTSGQESATLSTSFTIAKELDISDFIRSTTNTTTTDSNVNNNGNKINFRIAVTNFNRHSGTDTFINSEFNQFIYGCYGILSISKYKNSSIGLNHLTS